MRPGRRHFEKQEDVPIPSTCRVGRCVVYVNLVRRVSPGRCFAMAGHAGGAYSREASGLNQQGPVRCVDVMCCLAKRLELVGHCVYRERVD